MPSGPFLPLDPGRVPATGPERGSLLVAAPTLDDPNFSRRVVLVIDHGLHGALGIVLNRPGGVPVEEILPAWHALAGPPAQVFTGGPVARNALIGLVRLTGPVLDPEADDAGEVVPPPGWRTLVEDDRPVGTVDLATDPGGPGAPTGGVLGARVFSGYAGWDAGQLEEEIGEGSWFVMPAQARDPLSADPEGLWRRVLRRQGGALALVASFPDDPNMN